MAGAGEIDIGFVEKPSGHPLTSPYFPSKVGGRPAWLSFDLPSDADLTCGKCGGIVVFLLQVYSPRDTEDAFHRTCFVFVCRNADCCQPNSSANFKVFRSQLPRHNDCYSSDPPDEEGEVVTVSCPVPLCEVCGNPGRKKCAACQSANYCCKQHQQLHWKAGHKRQCKQQQKGQTSSASDPGKGILFPEFEIVTEVASCSSDGEDDDTETAESEAPSSVAGSNPSESLSEEDLNRFATKETANDRQLQRFKKAIALNPDFAEQVLRHQIGGRPLWIAADHQATEADVPPCSCGAPREFEFQVMPQLLSHLEVDATGASLDWGVLCVYTCSRSCPIGRAYRPEFIWKQDVTD